MTDDQIDEAAGHIQFFREAVSKLGSDKEPTDPVGQSWLTCPLAHLSPDIALDTSWDESDSTWILFGKRTGLEPHLVYQFVEWWDEIGHNNPDCRILVFEAMGHDPANELLPPPLDEGADNV